MTSGPVLPDSLPCDASLLVPHEPPMLLVRRLIEKADEDDENGISVIEATVPHSGPFIFNNSVLPEYCIEVMAQAIASVDGYPLQEGRSPSTGFLAGVDSFSWSGSPEPGEDLRILLKKTFSFGSVYVFSGSIIGPSGQLAEGQLKIWKMETSKR